MHLLLGLALQPLFVTIELGFTHQSGIRRGSCYLRDRAHLWSDAGLDGTRMLVERHLLILGLHHVIDTARDKRRHVNTDRTEPCLIALAAHVAIRLHLCLKLIHWCLGHREPLMLIKDASAIHHWIWLLAHHLVCTHTILIREALASHHHRTLLVHCHLLLNNRRTLEISLHLHGEVGTLWHIWSDLLSKVLVELTLMLWIHHTRHTEKLILLLLLWEHWSWLHHSGTRRHAGSIGNCVNRW